MSDIKVMNIHTGKMEHCTIGAGCKRHFHNREAINEDKIHNVASSLDSLYTTDIEKEYAAGNTFGGQLKEYSVTRINDKIEKVIAIESRLGGEPIGLAEGDITYVEINRQEVRFMDKDKMTHALGYVIFKDNFAQNKGIYITYSLYGTSGDSNIYRVERLS